MIRTKIVALTQHNVVQIGLPFQQASAFCGVVLVVSHEFVINFEVGAFYRRGEKVHEVDLTARSRKLEYGCGMS